MCPKATFVAIKTLAQQDIQSLERIRERLIKNRTALANQLRGLLAEYGVITEKKVAMLRLAIPFILEDAENSPTSISRAFTDNLYQELLRLDERIASTEKSSDSLLVNNNDYRRLQTIPRVGPVTGRVLAEKLFVRLTMLSSLKMAEKCQLELVSHLKCIR